MDQLGKFIGDVVERKVCFQSPLRRSVRFAHLDRRPGIQAALVVIGVGVR